MMGVSRVFVNSVGVVVVGLRDVLAHLLPGVAGAAIVGWSVQLRWRQD
jgi:hypothetical protein